jgi:hypothetical protein
METLRRSSVGHRQRQRKFSDAVIIATLLWAVLNDRPISWACRPRNWPFYMRVRECPTPSTMSRRLRCGSVLALMRRLEAELRERPVPAVALIIDAKPLPVGGYTRDRDAQSGRACGCFAKGYKLYLVIDENRCVHAWKVASMNVAEQRVAEELIPAAAASAGGGRWILGDKAYDSNRLHACAAQNGLSLLAPRLRPWERMNPGQARGRYRAAAMLEPGTPLGTDLMRRRETIERFLGTLSVTGGGLSPLPGFVRGQQRVARWVGAKLLISQAARRLKKGTSRAA